MFGVRCRAYLLPLAISLDPFIEAAAQGIEPIPMTSRTIVHHDVISLYSLRQNLTNVQEHFVKPSLYIMEMIPKVPRNKD